MAETKIPVNWGTIRLGWVGPKKYFRLLSIADIASFARDLIEANPNQPPEVLKLACASDNEGETVDACIKTLADSEVADDDLEIRKWRLILLKDTINALGDDPLYGLIGLTEFWEKFDYPSDSPHIIQGRNNEQSPKEYYTEDNYKHILERHRQWIAEEETLIRT